MYNGEYDAYLIDQNQKSLNPSVKIAFKEPVTIDHYKLQYYELEGQRNHDPIEWIVKCKDINTSKVTEIRHVSKYTGLPDEENNFRYTDTRLLPN